jgi:hypothetical protein
MIISIGNTRHSPSGNVASVMGRPHGGQEEAAEEGATAAAREDE